MSEILVNFVIAEGLLDWFQLLLQINHDLSFFWHHFFC